MKSPVIVLRIPRHQWGWSPPACSIEALSPAGNRGSLPVAMTGYDGDDGVRYN